MSKRIQVRKQTSKPKREDQIIELRPGVWMFTPAWAVKK